jgi:hypothetical protein
LARGKQPSTPRPFLNQRPLILGKDPLHLEQHLFLRTRAEAALHKDDLAATSGELLDQHHLIGIATGESIRSRHQNHLKSAFGRQIP